MAKYISKQAAIYALTNEANTHSNPVKRAYTRAAAIIEQITAEDVQPVKHGRWIEVTPKHSRCTVCDITCLIAVYPISGGANYCPNCGARMDLKDGDAE